MVKLFLILLIGVQGYATEILKISGGIGYKINSVYDDTLANVDVTYLKNYDKNYTYGISAGLFRMSYYWKKDAQGVDISKIEGFESLYVCGRAGVSIKPVSFMYMEFISGPCLFEKAKNIISGTIQFNTEIGYGFRDPKTKSTIGIVYRHISNGGLHAPNFGANLYLFTMGVAY